MTGFWCESAWVADRAVDDVVLTVDGGVITGVDSGVAASPIGAKRLDGLTLPGFANAHSHAFHRALRGRTHDHAADGHGTFWTWRDQMYRLAGSLDPDVYEELATATFAEMVLAGYTVVGEFHYLHHGPGGVPYADSNEMGHRMLRAAERAGIRITLLDTCYLHGGIAQPLNDVQQRFSDGTADAWASRVSALAALPATGTRVLERAGVPGDPRPDAPYSGALQYSGGRSRVGAAVHSVRAVDPSSIEVVGGWASEAWAPFHAHVSEQPKENEDCVAAHGCTPLELLGRTGTLEDFTAVHATHLTANDVALLAKTRARVCICATTERELADGIGPTAELSDAGIALCIGSDSHAVIDPFEETRAIELDERLASLQRGTHQPAALLGAATRNGYASLGWDGGELAVGQLADFVSVSFNSPRLAGADRSDPAAAVVFAAAPADVRHVVVGGEHVVRDGVHQGVDVVAALDSSIRAAWQASDR